MARPIRQNADYYTHCASLRNDRRVKAIRTAHGAAGYGIFVMLLEVLTDADNTTLAVDGMELELLAGDFGVTSDEINSVILFAQKVGYFATDASGMLICSDLNEWLAPVFDKRSRSKNAVNPGFLSQKLPVRGVSVTETPVSVTETPQSKVKESKVKESKEKNVVYILPSVAANAAKIKNEVGSVEQLKAFAAWQKWAGVNAAQLLKLKAPINPEELERLMGELGKDTVKEIALAMQNHGPLLKKYTSGNLTMRQWAKNRTVGAGNRSQYGPAPTPERTRMSATPKNSHIPIL